MLHYAHFDIRYRDSEANENADCGSRFSEKETEDVNMPDNFEMKYISKKWEIFPYPYKTYHPWEYEDMPWSRIHADFGEFRIQR